jgi:hypothetical protein
MALYVLLRVELRIRSVCVGFGIAVAEGFKFEGADSGSFVFNLDFEVREDNLGTWRREG